MINVSTVSALVYCFVFVSFCICIVLYLYCFVFVLFCIYISICICIFYQQQNGIVILRWTGMERSVPIPCCFSCPSGSRDRELDLVKFLLFLPVVEWRRNFHRNSHAPGYAPCLSDPVLHQIVLKSFP